MVFDYADYRELLRDEFSKRRTRNPQYSLRSFARDLDIPVSRLSEVLNNKMGIFASTAERISRALNLNEEERRYFMVLVDALHARSAQKRAVAMAEIDRVRRPDNLRFFSPDELDPRTNWLCLALFETIAKIENVDTNPVSLAARFGVPPEDVEKALEALVQGEHLERTAQGKYSAPVAFMASSAKPFPSQSVRQLHRVMMGKAREALENHPLEERYNAFILMALSDEQVTHLRRVIQDFVLNVTSKAPTTQPKNKIYALQAHLFRLDQPSGVDALDKPKGTGENI